MLLEHIHQGAGILGLGKLTHHLLGLPELVQHLVDDLRAGAAAQGNAPASAAFYQLREMPFLLGH